MSAILFLVFLQSDHNITRVEGIALTSGIVIFCLLCIREAKRGQHTLDFVEADLVPHLKDFSDSSKKHIAEALVFLVGGLIGLLLGSNLLIESGTHLGRAWGVPDELIGLFAFAVGTSLPELAISLIAAIKGEEEIALGNIVGSNVFNVFCVGGITATITPLTATAQLVNWDLMIMILVSFVFLAFLRVGRSINRFEGATLLTGYFLYAANNFGII